MINGDASHPGKVMVCSQCGTDCVIDATSLNDFIIFDKKCYHNSCFIEAAKAHRRGKYVEALEHYPKLQEESKQHLTDIYIKDALYCFLLQYYGLTVIPVYFWKKLADLNNGRYVNVSVAIPYTHLYDMWRRKRNQLNKLADTNKAKGKEMTGEQRLHYDLAVLINQYDSYLRFLEREKIKEAVSEQDHKSIVPTNFTYNYSNKNINQEDQDGDIDELVGEVFGE